MYKNILSSIPGIELYPIVALILFFGFFVGIIVWYLRVDRTKLEHEAQLALKDGMSLEHSSTQSIRS